MNTTHAPEVPPAATADVDPREIQLIDATASMLGALCRLSDPELNALFDAMFLARGQAARDARPRLVGYFERSMEWLLVEFGRRNIRPKVPRRARRDYVPTPRMPLVSPSDERDA